MRRVLAAFVLSLLLCCCAAGQAKSVREANGLIGPVNTVITMSARLSKEDGEWVEGEMEPVSQMVFDRDGNYGHPGGRQQGPGAPVGEPKIKYDDKGREVECVYEFPDGGSARTTTKYVEKGRVTEQAIYKAGGVLYARHVTAYDEKDNYTYLESYDSNNTLVRKLTWVYDEKGNRTEWTESTRSKGELRLFSKITSAFDDKGNVTEETQYGNPEGSITRQVFTYVSDSVGNWVKRERVWIRTDVGSGTTDEMSRIREYRTITYYPAQ